MRKLLVYIISIAMAAALAACTGKTTEDREQADDTDTSTLTETDIAGDSETEAEGIISDFEEEDKNNGTDRGEDHTMKITAGRTTFTATFADNSSAEALRELLKEGPLTIDMNDYAGMEKVGPIGTSLPRNDEQIETGAGDIILYQGNSLVIYYDTNSWNFTRIGKIDGVSREELLDALGDGDVTVTFSLE